MADNSRLMGWLGAVASTGLLVLCAVIASPASAEDAQLQGSTGTGQSVDLATAPEVKPAAPPAGLAINRPTIPMADYIAAKNAAAARARAGKTRRRGAPGRLRRDVVCASPQHE